MSHRALVFLWLISTSIILSRSIHIVAKGRISFFQSMSNIPLCVYIYIYGVSAKSLQSCLTLCDPVNCSPPGSSVHGILQTRLLEWVATPSSRGSSWPRLWSCISYVSFIGRQVLYHLCLLGSPCILAHLLYSVQEMRVWSWVGKISCLLLEKEMAIQSCVLPWEIPWTADPGRLLSVGLQKSWSWLSK